VHDGEAPRHVPSRLVVAVEAPEEMISRVLDRRPEVRALFDNGWLTLLALDSAGAGLRRYEDGAWAARPVGETALRAAA
jgi:uncharacterized protein YbcC (UPF0753/DUF2309 family)